ncbi:glutaredoxin family protein [Sporosarcina pasteurii]|uniref:Glutaredoxin-like domain (DUF836) n=1 Tax=Sporosarcina pasteurii TaxID=1474 RepID=A0A380C9F2_SPOPA|nr:glutaredoxin family protein [Sporosarcina pasteurii]MDS9472695.1 glutaredoxin family protein [Sporosarcina pasteurii]QBQ04353.1 glutaredoxin family protein [Sporosarcina pasteurii]SUJ15696.1 Glutaredoxin-like domain (DUF836) [Sporosarcina pasteurii]
MHVTFYWQDNCPLCDEAEMMMKLAQEDYPFTWTSVDIQTDDDIHEKYMLMVPVLEKDGEVLLYGNIGYIDLVDLFEK